MDWSEKDLCIKCNGGGNLLICSENGCPLAVHEECMGCPARYDDAGRFYCPYCWYKKAVGEARRAREYALERKKALLLFMDDKTLSSEQQVEENKIAEDKGRNESKTSEGNVKITAYNDGTSKVNSGAILDGPIQHEKKQKSGNAEEEKVQEEESEASAGSKDQNPSLELHEEQRTGNEEEKKDHEEEHETSAPSSGEDPSHNMHEHEISDNEGKKIQEEENETISDSTGEDPSLTLHARANTGSKKRKRVEWDTDAVSVPNKLRKQLDKNKQTSPVVDETRRSSRRSSSAPNKEVSNEVVAASKNSKKCKQSPVKARDTFISGKRRRLFWREEEEDMIRVGVKKYSKEAKIPWRKILDEGRHTFDATRTPGDLKDKWRNISAK